MPIPRTFAAGVVLAVVLLAVPSVAQAQSPTRYVLVDGTTIVGTVVSADETTVTVQTSVGTARILKANILSAQPAAGAPATPPGYGPPPAYGPPQGVYAAPSPYPAAPMAGQPYGAPPATPARAGWAGGAAILGFISAGLLVVGAGAAAATVDDADTSIAIGAVTTLFGAAVIPVVAVGGGSADGVRGQPALRIAGWIGYGLALLDAVALLAISIEGGYIEPALTIGVGVLGALSAVCFSIDALSRASEARRLSGGVALMPVLGIARIGDRRAVPTLGVRVAF